MLKFLALGLLNAAAFTAAGQSVPTATSARPTPPPPPCDPPEHVRSQAVYVLPPATPAHVSFPMPAPAAVAPAVYFVENDSPEPAARMSQAVGGCSPHEPCPQEAKRQQLLRKAQAHQLEAQVLMLEAQAVTLDMQKAAVQKQLDETRKALADEKKKPAATSSKPKATSDASEVFSFHQGFTR